MAQVSSYNVANRSGAQVREDINDIFDAIKTCNSGASDPSSPAKFMLYGDSASGDDNLRIYDGVSQFRPIGKVTEDNLGLLPRSGGKMVGEGGNVAQIELDDAGTAAQPALSFDTNTDLGLFLKGANQMGFASGGAEQLFIDGFGLTLNNQKELRLSEPTSAATGGSVQYVGFKAPDTVAANVVWKLPNADTNVAGYALISDGSGNLSWGVAGAGAQGSGNDKIFWENDQTVTQNYEITNGKNAGSFGPIEIQGGVTVTVGAGESWTIV